MADDQNPWSLEGWSLTAQMAYAARFGMARAEARARDAGTTVGGRPAAPKAPAVAPDTSKDNPWSRAGWSKTGQARYLAAHGLARAEARARDAGSTLVGQPAPQPGTMAAVALVRPGSPAIYRVPQAGGVHIPPRRKSLTKPGVLPRVAMALGFTEAAGPYTEADIAAALALGLTEAAVLQAGTSEVDLAATAALGITVAAALLTEADLAVSAAALGVTMVASTCTEADLAASAVLGVTMVASTYIEADLAASAALGVALAAALQAEVDLLLDVRTTEAGDVRITQAGDTRVTETDVEGLGVSMVATLTLV